MNQATVQKVEVFPGRLRVRVQLAEGAPRFVDESMFARACEAYPTLPAHSCINSKGPAFGDVAVGTSVPHLLEHLVIAEQVRMAGELRNGSAAARATYVGTSEWGPGGLQDGKAVVEVSFMDDLDAVAALGRALSFLNGIL